MTAELEEDADDRKVLDDIKAAVDRIETFPVETEKPVVSEVDTRRRVITIVLHGEASEKTLKALAERVRDELTAYKGVSQVEVAGVRNYEISIEVSQHDADVWEAKVEFWREWEFEQMRNLSQLPNSKESVIEPRIVAVPGTIKDPATGQWTGIPEDKQNRNVFYVSYGTSTNPDQTPGSGDELLEFPAPLDLYYSLSQDKGESYVEVTWEVNPDSDGNFAGEEVTRWDWMAKGDPEQGEAQLRMTPDGSRFYATWLQESEEGSDIWFRRIMSPTFSSNVAKVLEKVLLDQ